MLRARPNPIENFVLDAEEHVVGRDEIGQRAVVIRSDGAGSQRTANDDVVFHAKISNSVCEVIKTTSCK